VRNSFISGEVRVDSIGGLLVVLIYLLLFVCV